MEKRWDGADIALFNRLIYRIEHPEAINRNLETKFRFQGINDAILERLILVNGQPLPRKKQLALDRLKRFANTWAKPVFEYEPMVYSGQDSGNQLGLQDGSIYSGST